MKEKNISYVNRQVFNCTYDGYYTPEILDLSTVGKTFIGLIICILILVGFCGNAVVCLIVYRKPQMRSAINLLLANMALSDILVSVLCMTLPFTALMNGEWQFGQIISKVQYFLWNYFSAVATFILFIMSGDRYMIIVKRRDKLNTKFAKVFIALIWTIPFLLALPPVFNLGYNVQYGHTKCTHNTFNRTYDLAYSVIKFTLDFFLPCVIMGYVFIAIGNAVRTNMFRVRNHSETEVSLSIAQMSARLGFVLLPMKARMNIDVKFKTRTFKTIMLLYLVLFICLSPYSTNQFVSNIIDNYLTTKDTVILWIAFSKSAINPVIYFFRIKKFREACGEFIPKRCKGRLRWFDKTNRRINPSALYQYHGEHTVTSTV